MNTELLIREALDSFDDDLAKRNRVVTILRDAIANGVPYVYGMETGDKYFNVTVYAEWNSETQRSDIDIKGTQAELRKVVKWARSRGYGVKKEYSGNTFQIVVTYGDEYGEEITFNANREIVCERKVTGTRIIPAREVEEVEWDCNKVTFSVRVD